MNKVNSEEKERWQSPVVIKETAPPSKSHPQKPSGPSAFVCKLYSAFTEEEFQPARRFPRRPPARFMTDQPPAWTDREPDSVGLRRSSAGSVSGLRQDAERVRATLG